MSYIHFHLIYINIRFYRQKRILCRCSLLALCHCSVIFSLSTVIYFSEFEKNKFMCCYYCYTFPRNSSVLHLNFFACKINCVLYCFLMVLIYFWMNDLGQIFPFVKFTNNSAQQGRGYKTFNFFSKTIKTAFPKIQHVA